MRILTIRIERDTDRALARAAHQFIRAWKSGKYRSEYRSFESVEALFRVLTPARWTLVETLQALGPSSLRGLARAAGRDVKAVHRDVQALMARGLIERDEKRHLRVPFARIHAEFDLSGGKSKAA